MCACVESVDVPFDCAFFSTALFQEAKLKRLLAMAKRSIDNSKHEIAEKDSIINQLREQVRDHFTGLS